MSLMAQGSFGSIRGAVVDTAGAAVAGATVEIKNQATNEARTVTTNSDGEYSVGNLNVGLYTVSVTAQGFAISSVKDVRISVAFVTEQNLTASPAGATAQVNITSGDTSTQVNTTDQQLSTIITNQKIMDLPLLSRDPSSLVLLSPGTVQTDTGLGGFSINGSRERNNNFLVDGVDNNDTDVPGIPGGVATPNIDATEEFRVITANGSAEYGRNTGGIITTATKRGTNDYHGNVYYYYRSDQFAARNFFDTTGSADPLKRKQYGGSLGGPVFKDKLFFFFNYEGNRSDSGSQQLRLVPTAAARTGVFTTAQFGTLDIRPTGAQNGTGPQLTGGANLPWSPTTVALLNAIFPLPNYPANGAVPAPLPGAFEYYQFGYIAKDKVDSIAARVDYSINSSNTLTFSANYGKGDYALFPPTFDKFNDENRTPQKGGVYSLTLLSNFTPNLANEFRLGTNRVDAAFNGSGDGTSSNALNDAVKGILNANGVAYPTFGSTNARNLNLLLPFTSISNFDTQSRITGTTTIGDSMTWVTGKHIMKFGGELRMVYSNGQSNFSRQEALDFRLAANFAFPLVLNSAGTAFLPTTGNGGLVNDYLSFLTGVIATQSQTQFFDKAGKRQPNDLRRYRTNEWGGYFQDSWRVRSDFTLNFGLRYEFNSVPYEKNGLMSNLVDQDASGRTPTGGFTFKTVGKNSDNPDIPLYDPDKNNFAPRFGFNYSPSMSEGFLSKVFGGPGKSSIRGGFGVFYDRVFTNLFSNTSSNLPFSTSLFEIPLNNPGDFTINGVPRLSTSVATNRQLEGDEGSAVIFPTSKNNILQTKFEMPSSNAWNFGFERDLGNDFLLEADYVATKGVHLIRDVNAQLTSITRTTAITGTPHTVNASLRTNYLNGSLNTAFGQSSAFLILSNGNSRYDSMQLRITKTLTNRKFGLGQLQAFYTWSHSIDDAADALVVGTSDRSLPRDSSGFVGGLRAERGDSTFDARHRFVANFIYQIPFMTGTRLRDKILGNWVISGIYQTQTGYPFSVFANGVDTQGTGLSARATYNTRADRLSSTQTAANTRIYTGPDRSLFNGAPCTGNVPHPADPAQQGCTVFGAPAQGTAGRSQFRGPNFSKTDFSLIKRFPINERMKFSIRADFFNLFNRVNLSVPVADVTSTNFGLSLSAGAPRIIQFAGRFDF